ncbi:MAG: type II/IV secretion system ATPase subunit [Zestosphaera sp.]
MTYVTKFNDESLRISYTIPSIIEIRVDIIEGVDKKLRYRVHEPVLSDTGRTLLNAFIYKVYHDLNLMKRLSNYGFSREAYETVVGLVRDYLKRGFSLRLGGLFRSSPNIGKINEAEIHYIAYYVVRDLIGYGPIDPLIRDQQVEDITCNGVELPVYVFHREFEWLETNVVFPNSDLLERVIRVLAVKSGQEPSVANPIVEGVLRPEGYRVHIVLDTVSRRGHSFSIRRFRETPFTIVELLRRGVLDPGLAALFWMAVENKQGIVIYGPTGSGKTTLLNALAMFLPPEMKIVSVEDTPEIFLPFHENWDSMTTRLSNDPKVQSVTLQTQIESAMRQRPDVLILGEVRSREAYVFFQGVSTGHGGLTTVHAENIEALIRRLTSPPMNVPKSSIAAAKLYVNILRIPMSGNIVRKVTYVYEVREYDTLRDLISFKLISKWVRDEDVWLIDLKDSNILKSIAELALMKYEDLLTDLVRRATVLSYAAARNVDIFEFHATLRRYRRDPIKTFNEAKEFLRDSYRLVIHELEEKKSL